MTPIELEERLIKFSAELIKFAESLPNTKAAKQLGNQLLRSGTSPALNYAEAQSGESKKDFIHKMKIVVKELRETLANLKIIHQSIRVRDIEKLNSLITESNELVAIFVASVKTAEKNIEIPPTNQSN